ncbi:MAG: site-specific integrase [Deltaproteobacteria bacterium]|nr:site-specific integrase [Deltaproteobacteria bacterium]
MLDGYKGGSVVRAALRFAPLVFVRPRELRSAQWCDIDLDKAEWCFTLSKLKPNQPTVELLVPVSTQAVAILKNLKPLTGGGRYVFPGPRSASRPMSENAVLAAMRSMGISTEHMCGHGFRAMARTMLDEVLGFRPDIIEHQLGHVVKDPNGRAYNWKRPRGSATWRSRRARRHSRPRPRFPSS